jgi:hypothetical protein
MNNNLNLGQLIALLIPLVLVELGLLGFALFDLVKRKRVRGGNKWNNRLASHQVPGPHQALRQHRCSG